MLRSFPVKPIVRIAASVLGAALAIFSSFVVATVLLSTVAPEAKAQPQVASAVDVSHAKSDRLAALHRGAACSSLGWPHYEQSCQFDLRGPEHQARTVRIIALR